MVTNITPAWKGWKPEPTWRRLCEGAQPGGWTPWHLAVAPGGHQGEVKWKLGEGGIQGQDHCLWKAWRGKADREQDWELGWDGGERRGARGGRLVIRVKMLPKMWGKNQVRSPAASTHCSCHYILKEQGIIKFEKDRMLSCSKGKSCPEIWSA